MPPVTFGQSLPTIEVPEDVLYQAQSCITTQLILADLTDEDFSRQSLPGKGMRSVQPQGAALSDLEAPQTAPVATSGTGGAKIDAQMEQLLVIIRNQEITRIMQLGLQ